MKLVTKNYNFFIKGLAFFTGIFLLFCCYHTTALNINNRYAKTLIHFSKASKGKINVQVTTAHSKIVVLYLFTADGKLVKKMDTDTKTTYVVSGILEGQYLYQCFKNDTQLKSGKLIVKPNDISYD